MKIVFNDLVAVANAGGRFLRVLETSVRMPPDRSVKEFLEGCAVECPWHAAQWDITTGKALTGLATTDIPLFEVRVVTMISRSN